MGVVIVSYACMTTELSTTTAWDSQYPQKARALGASLLSYHVPPPLPTPGLSHSQDEQLQYKEKPRLKEPPPTSAAVV